MTKAMLEGDPYNMCYLACLNMGINIDHFIEELDRINMLRGPFTQHSNTPENAPVKVDPDAPSNKV